MEVHLQQCHNSELFLELTTRSRQLENCHRISCGQRDYLESRNKELRDSIQEQNKILENMNKKHIELTKRANSIKREDHHEMKQKHISVLNKVTLDEAKAMYEKLIQQILETKVKAYLKGLLTPTSELSPELDQKELYKIYGILLSACKIKLEDKKNSMLLEEAFGEPGLEEYRAKADILTHNMLKMLPPLLLVCDVKEQHGFNKELYDTFRPTWDDTKDLPKIFYYRPVLFYGNQHSIAVKGLVGNCEKPRIHNQWDSSTNQDLTEKELKKSDTPSYKWPQNQIWPTGVNTENHQSVFYRLVQDTSDKKKVQRCQVCKSQVFEADKVERNGKFWHKHHAKCSRCHVDLTDKANLQHYVMPETDLVTCYQCIIKESDKTSLFLSCQRADTTYQTIPRRNSSYFGQQKYSHTLSKQGAYGQSYFSGLSSITKQCAVCARNIMTVQMSKQLKKDQFIHQECYVCCLCNKYIETTNAIILETGQFICFRCNKCYRCKEVINEISIKYQGAHMTAGYLWHKSCFKCSTCHKPLEPEGYCLKCRTIGL